MKLRICEQEPSTSVKVPPLAMALMLLRGGIIRLEYALAQENLRQILDERQYLSERLVQYKIAARNAPLSNLISNTLTNIGDEDVTVADTILQKATARLSCSLRR